MLLNISKIWEDEASKIELRGYSVDERLAVPPELLVRKRDGSLQSLSVDKIASKHCPARRDLYLEVVEKKRGQGTWGRIAGPLIESYCKGLLGTFESLYDDNQDISYVDLGKRVETYTEAFSQEHEREFSRLDGLFQKDGSEDDPEKFLLKLKYTAQTELVMLGADWLLGRSQCQGAPSLLKRLPMKVGGDLLSIKPAEHIGIGKLSTPDLIVTNPPIVGDVKSGSSFEKKYLYTCTGYALAYESYRKMDVNYGVIYFFETHGETLNSAQCHFFLIDDRLRKEFLGERNDAYRTIQAPPPHPLIGEQQIKDYCTCCKFGQKCEEDRRAADG
jgi:CRISPR/Cas system-associated exonuclease Cas4 (RecB family)